MGYLRKDLNWGGTPPPNQPEESTSRTDKDYVFRIDTVGPVKPVSPEKQSPRGFVFNPITAEDLMLKDFPDPRWAIPDIVPDGLTILCGPPKSGKSWMALDWAIAVTTGGYALGKIKVEQGEVLYLGLEDTNRRMKERLGKLLPGSDPPSGLYIRTRSDGFPQLDKAGIQLLDEWLTNNTKVKLVIVDTWARAKPPHKGSRNMYEADVESLTPLQDLAFKHNVALIIVHHIRKMKADDILESVSGSFGVAGTADSIVILTRTGRKERAVLNVTGRDVEDQELNLIFQKGNWELLGEYEDISLSPLRQSILNELRENGPLTAKQISVALDKNLSTVKTTLHRLWDRHVLEKEEGYYSLPDRM